MLQVHTDFRNEIKGNQKVVWISFLKKKKDGEFNQRDDEKGLNFDDDYNFITFLSVR